ncbi:ROK family transcriptional regulator [Microbacterium sp. 2FI]|uniref:ROK family transcriptional regulator n=1 Tax=Microbacterium sp. 2FI TaxID=2502193 RepID=UPI0010F4535D|nr:ROK family transcriptional regulator [Microbacterium sp. 2FI]
MSSPSGLVSGDVRRHNLALVLDHLIRTGPNSRSEIAAGTGLTRGSVTALVQVLIDADWLRESYSVSGSKGRPRTRLEIASDTHALLAVQIASDSASVLATTLAGGDLVRLAMDHAGGDPAAVLDVTGGLVAEVVRRLKDMGRRVVDVTVVVLAPVGGSPARVLADVTLGWSTTDVVGELRIRVPDLRAVDLRLSSDTPVAAGAEFRRRGGVENAIYLKGDSNIGGALVVNGTPVHGAHGFAGSLGHLAVVPGGELCACGQHGCLITVAGVYALLRAAQSEPALESMSPSAALDLFVSRVEAEDPLATAAWGQAVPWIGRSLQILSMAVDPATIIIGGHWARLTPSIAAAFATDRPKIATGPDVHVEVVAGVLGAEAALRGAVEAARDRIARDPLALC